MTKKSGGGKPSNAAFRRLERRLRRTGRPSQPSPALGRPSARADCGRQRPSPNNYGSCRPRSHPSLARGRPRATARTEGAGKARRISRCGESGEHQPCEHRQTTLGEKYRVWEWPAVSSGGLVTKGMRKKSDHPSHHRPGTPLAGLLDQQGRGRRRHARRRIRQCHSVVGDPPSQPRAASCHASLRPLRATSASACFADMPMRARLRLVNRCDRVTIGFAGARSLLRAAAGCARVPGLDGVEAGPSEKAIVSLLTRCTGC